VEESVKREYTLRCDDPQISEPNRELAVMALLLSQCSGRQILEELLKRPVPMKVTVIHNTVGDDPPDLEAFGIGFEVTDFPPDQVPKEKVREKHRGILHDPPLHQTGGNLRKIEAQSVNPSRVRPPFFDPSKECVELTTRAKAMLQHKDVSTNRVLLLDQRSALWPDDIIVPVRSACTQRRPTHIQLIIAVRSSDSVRLYPL
jgi:hypothetical protein